MSFTQSQAESAQLSPGAAGLYRLGELAAQFGAERIAQEARSIGERVTEGLFYVACVGQFKRGKSTLLDALVGERILPTGVIPVTTVPTVIRYGAERRARVRLSSGAWEPIAVAAIEQYVSEEHNPQNQKGVAGVEVFVPSALLASGMCLVDTPGLGSVFAANTEATREFIPHIDAALAVFGADPPLSGDELELIAEVAGHVHDLVLVLNKADRTTDEERTASVEFSRRMLEKRLGREVGPIFQVSALERVEQRGAGRDWDALVGALEDLATQSGSRLTLRAAERGLGRLCDQLGNVLEEERQALLRPVEESERRITAMRTTLADAERSMRDLAYLFTAEQQRLHDLFLARRKEFLAGARPAAQATLEEWLQSAERGSGPGFRRRLMRQAQELARARVLPWLQGEQEAAERFYREATRRFVEAANGFLRRLAEAGVPELARMPHALDPERGFRARSRFSFHEFTTIALPASPFRLLADVFLGVAGAYAPIERAGQEFLEQLLETNSSRVQNDLDERVTESRSGLEADIRVLLLEIRYAAERALEHARATQAEGAGAVQAALGRLAGVQRELDGLRRTAGAQDA